MIVMFFKRSLLVHVLICNELTLLCMCQSMGSGGIESGFSDINISGGGGGGCFGSGFGFGLSTDIELFSTKSKRFCLFVCMNIFKNAPFLNFFFFYQLGMLMCGTCLSLCESSISICCSSKMLVMH